MAAVAVQPPPQIHRKKSAFLHLRSRLNQVEFVIKKLELLGAGRTKECLYWVGHILLQQYYILGAYPCFEESKLEKVRKYVDDVLNNLDNPNIIDQIFGTKIFFQRLLDDVNPVYNLKSGEERRDDLDKKTLFLIEKLELMLPALKAYCDEKDMEVELGSKEASKEARGAQQGKRARAIERPEPSSFYSNILAAKMLELRF